MSETALKFGPEWLRALSHGGTVSSPPSSPGPTKFKLAEYRYGREEMLALFTKDLPPPDGLQNLGTLLVKQIQEPLAILPINPEEQRMWHQSVNSEAVLRGTGRSTMNGVGRGRGGSADRGRGRGRGVAAPYYSRGISYDEEQESTRAVATIASRENGPPGMRPKGFERSQSMSDSRGVWAGERIPAERTAAVEERGGAVSPRKEQGRAATGNWRSRNEKENDRWRGLANPREKWGNRVGWRERENGAEGEWEEVGRGNNRNNRSSWDEKNEYYKRNWGDEDNLPEWATEESEDKGGSFDATGAFHAPGSSDEDDVKEQPPEKDVGQTNEPLSKQENSPIKENPIQHVTTKPHKEFIPKSEEESLRQQSSPLVNGLVSDDDRSCSSSSQSPSVSKDYINHRLVSKPFEDDKLEHMQSVADDLVAKLIEDDDPSGVGEPQIHNAPPPPGGFLSQADPLQTAGEQWFYTDPQGDIQGPFSSSDMAAWCKAGYFKPDLLLRRDCDDKFAQLGDLTTVFGRVPFLPGPPVPPLKVSELLNAQKAQAERERLLQAYQMQTQQQQMMHQNTLRQQVMQQLHSLDEWNSLSVAQQQQLFMQHMVVLNPTSGGCPSTLPTPSHPSIVTSDPRLLSSTSNQIPGTPAAPPPDPIQAFVAQMASSQLPEGANNSAASVGSASPLEKLISQLKKTQTPNSSAPPVMVPGPPPSNIPPMTSNNKPPEQFDAIKSFMSQLNKMQVPDNLQTEESRIKDVEQKRIEDEKKRFEELKRAEEDRIRMHELRLQEERYKEEEKRKELEAKNQRLEEELKRMQEEQYRRREQETMLKIEENNKVREEHQKALEAQLRKEEEIKRQKQKHEEEKRQLEEKKRKQEEKKKAEEDKRRQEEIRRKEEKERQHQMRIQEEMRKAALEEERRRMQKLEAEELKKQEEILQNNAILEKKKQAPPAWNNQLVPKDFDSAPSLSEIQKAQELKDKKEREVEAVREAERIKEVQRQVAEEHKQKEAKIKWASKVSQSTKGSAKNASQPPVKSLKEIQKEEEKEMKKRQEKEQSERAAVISQMSLNSAGVWGSAAQSLSWANRASSTGVHPINSQGPQVWGSQLPNNPGAWSSVTQISGLDASAGWNSQQHSGGFWESPNVTKGAAVKATTPITTRAASNKGGNNKTIVFNQAVNSNNKANKKKSKDESEAVKKLFVNNISPADGFTAWCKTSLHSMKVHASIDIPTFVGFLSDVESPYDVHDYIRSYLGDSKEVKDFAKQYLERRSKARNAQKEQLMEDNILAPAPAVNPVVSTEFQEVKTRLKKGKKKMQRIDSNILGFNMALEDEDSG